MSHVILFCSRNKDNRDLPGFKERRRAFFDDGRDMIDAFMSFVDKGVPGEVSRYYRSVNDRDMESTKKELICELVKGNGIFQPWKLENKAVSIAMEARNAVNNQWLFDFDLDSYEKMLEFLADLRSLSVEVVRVEKTVHGYAIVVFRGFDTRLLMEKWGDIVELKRDGMLLIDWATKKED